MSAPVFIYGPTTFAVVSDSLARAMLTVGNTEGFTTATEKPRLDRLTIEQRGPRCYVDHDHRC